MEEEHRRPSAPPSDRRQIGWWRGILFDVAAIDAVHAPVDLFIAGMFAREMPGSTLGGGLAHLDQALGGALIRLRADGIFGGAIGESLMLSAPPDPLRARTLLLLGLGEPRAWNFTTMRDVAALAMRTTLCMDVRSAAFAPCLLDSGLSAATVAGAAEAMMDGVLGAVDTTPDAAAPPLGQWTFDAGKEHLEAAASDFRRAFARWSTDGNDPPADL